LNLNRDSNSLNSVSNYIFQGITPLSGEEFMKRVETHEDTNQDTDSGLLVYI